MSDYVCLNTTLRRVDGGRVTSVEVGALDEFFKEEFGHSCYSIRPYLCHNEDEVFGSVEVKDEWFEPSSFSVFAANHPDIQIEVIACYSDSNLKDERHLFQGDVWEELKEVRYFPKPEIIQWTGNTVV